MSDGHEDIPPAVYAADDECDIPAAEVRLPDKAQIKQDLLNVAMEKYRLSYTIPTFSGFDRWDLKTYTMYKDKNGCTYIEDDDTSVRVIAYDGPVKWWPEYTWAAIGWQKFIPEEAYGEWKVGTSAKWKDVPGGGWSGS